MQAGVRTGGRDKIQTAIARAVAVTERRGGRRGGGSGGSCGVGAWRRWGSRRRWLVGEERRALVVVESVNQGHGAGVGSSTEPREGHAKREKEGEGRCKQAFAEKKGKEKEKERGNTGTDEKKGAWREEDNVLDALFDEDVVPEPCPGVPSEGVRE